MTTNIQSVHFDADKKLLSFIEEKVSKLTLFHEGLISCDVILRLDKSDNAANKIAEIKVLVRGQELFAKKQCASFEEAVDASCNAIKTQLKKYKEKTLVK
ncbi:MAG: raiA [Bacteroidetes bacterium]|jgi:putative sigma-54 modulation protein|nr:raiA [Bacteroidota bacterium]